MTNGCSDDFPNSNISGYKSSTQPLRDSLCSSRSGVTKQRKQSGTPGLLGLDTSEDGVEFVFHEGYNPKGNLTNPITCTEWLEKDLVAQTEWIKFFALPFNKEREANEIFDQIKGTMDCIGANTDTFSSLYSTDYKALTVMTAAYSEWSEGWVVSAGEILQKSQDHKNWRHLKFAPRSF